MQKYVEVSSYESPKSNSKLAHKHTPQISKHLLYLMREESNPAASPVKIVGIP